MSKIAIKTFSWLIVSGILILLAGGISTGNWHVAFWAAFWACLLKTPVYFGHEYLFEKLWKSIIYRRGRYEMAVDDCNDLDCGHVSCQSVRAERAA